MSQGAVSVDARHADLEAHFEHSAVVAQSRCAACVLTQESVTQSLVPDVGQQRMSQIGPPRPPRALLSRSEIASPYAQPRPTSPLDASKDGTQPSPARTHRGSGSHPDGTGPRCCDERKDRMQPKPLKPRTLVLALAVMALAYPAIAEEEDPIEAMRAEIEAMRQQYEARIAALEARLAELEAARQADELTEIRRAAAAAAAETTTEATTGSVEGPTVGHERNLNQLNPEISVTGIVLANSSDPGRNEIEAQEFELDLQAALDPFSPHPSHAVGARGGHRDRRGLPAIQLATGEHDDHGR